MEKRLPHYPLAVLQARIAEQGIMAFTATALFNAAAMGLSEEQVLQVMACGQGSLHQTDIAAGRRGHTV